MSEKKFEYESLDGEPVEFYQHEVLMVHGLSGDTNTRIVWLNGSTSDVKGTPFDFVKDVYGEVG